MNTAMTDGRVSISVSRPDQFASQSTSGSTPVVLQQVEASLLEGTKYDIAGMVRSRMTRLLVVCDMHGADLKEILGPRSSQVNLHDGRSVMREAILAEMNRLSRDIQKTLDQAWP